MISKIRSTISNKKTDDGASAVEYGLLVAAIAALIVVVVFILGGYVQEAFNKTCDEIGAKDNNAATDADCEVT